MRHIRKMIDELNTYELILVPEYVLMYTHGGPYLVFEEKYYAQEFLNYKLKDWDPEFDRTYSPIYDYTMIRFSYYTDIYWSQAKTHTKAEYLDKLKKDGYTYFYKDFLRLEDYPEESKRYVVQFD